MQIWGDRPGPTLIAALIVALVMLGLAAAPAAAQENCTDPGAEIYDDGTAEDGYTGDPEQGGQLTELVQLFTPRAHPGTYDAVCVALTTDDVVRNLAFEIQAVAAVGGRPGQQLGAVRAQANGIPVFPQCRFYRFNTAPLGLRIERGPVFLGVRWVTPSVYLCADLSPSTPLRSAFFNFNLDGPWSSLPEADPEYRALLVRAVGRKLPPGRIGSNFVMKFTVETAGKFRSIVRSARFSRVPRGARVNIRCNRRCTFKGRGRKRNRNLSGSGNISANRLLKGQRLRPGAVIETRVTRRGSIGKYISYRTRRGKLTVRTERCLPVGSNRPRRKC